MNAHNGDAIRDKVRDRYGRIVSSKNEGCACSSTCCSTETKSAKAQSAKIGYCSSELDAVPDGANMGLGCGNPQAIAMLQPGEIVLDLGCGGGFDCFLASQKVGDEGRVIGVDMTPEMLNKARENARKGGFSNVEFRLGEIEHLPVADNCVDVIISNCVVNLSADKEQVYREVYRVLRKGGRVAVFDVVAVRELPDSLKNDLEKHAGCIAGTVTVEDVQRMLSIAGFGDVRVNLKEASRDFIKDWFPGSGAENYVLSAEIQARK